MGDGTVTGALTAAVLGVALYCAARLVAGALARRSIAPDADVSHVVMGVSMAGMLTGWLSGTWNDAWLAAYGVSTLWWGAHVWRGVVGRASLERAADHLPHLVGSIVMMYMLAVAAGGGSGAHSMGAMGGSGAVGTLGTGAAAGAGVSGTPLVAIVFAALLVADALVVASRQFVVPGAGRAAFVAQPGAPGPRSHSWPAAFGPRASALCLVVMSVAMAYMVIVMRL